VALLVAPAGYWLRRRAEAGLALVTVAAALWLLPRFVRLEAAGPTVSAVALGTMALAAWMGRRTSPDDKRAKAPAGSIARRGS
jgi:hypothetical protein